MERSSQVLQHRNPKIWIFFQNSLKLNFDLYFDLCWIAEITLASSISVAYLAIDTSMERSSRELQHGNPKIWFKKKSKLNFDSCWQAEITLASSISILHWKLIHLWKGLHEYYNMPMENVNFKKLRQQKRGKFRPWNSIFRGYLQG